MGENTYEAPVVNTLDGNGNGTDPNVQPAGLVWQTENCRCICICISTCSVVSD